MLDPQQRWRPLPDKPDYAGFPLVRRRAARPGPGALAGVERRRCRRADRRPGLRPAGHALCAARDPRRVLPARPTPGSRGRHHGARRGAGSCASCSPGSSSAALARPTDRSVSADRKMPQVGILRPPLPLARRGDRWAGSCGTGRHIGPSGPSKEPADWTRTYVRITIERVQLCLDAADRLVELVEERRGPVPADEAARLVLKLGAAVPVGLARSLLDEAVRDDARLRWAGDLVALAGRSGGGAVTGDGDVRRLRPRDDGAAARLGATVRVRRRAGRGLELGERFQTLANPGARLAPAVAALTGLRDEELRRAPPVAAAVRRFLDFAGDAVLVAHNARFDMAFLDDETMRLDGQAGRRNRRRHGRARSPPARPAAGEPGGARVPLRDRRSAVPPRAARRGGDRGDPALPDRDGAGARRAARSATSSSSRRHGPAASTASAASRSARRSGPASTCSATRTTRCSTSAGRATCVRGSARTSAPTGSGPAVEAALGALERIEWRVLGSEVEAALEELRLIRELRPPANARSARPDRYVYLKRRGDSVVCSATADRARPARPAGAAPSSPRGRCRVWSGRRSRTRCRSCARSSAALRATSGSRTRRACATGSPRSRTPPARSQRMRRLRGARGLPRRSRRAGRHPSRRLRGERAGRLHPPVPRDGGARVAGRARGGRARRADARCRGRRRSPRARLVHPPPAAGAEVIPLAHFTAWSSYASARSARLAEARRRRRDRHARRAAARPGGEDRRRAAHRDGRRARLAGAPRRAARAGAERPPARTRRRRPRATHEEGELARLHGRAVVYRAASAGARPTRRSIRCRPTTRSSARREISRDKERQVQHYVELLRPLPLWERESIRVVDAGCGKAYMSLALVAYGREVGTRVELIGVDVERGRDRHRARHRRDARLRRGSLRGRLDRRLSSGRADRPARLAARVRHGDRRGDRRRRAARRGGDRRRAVLPPRARGADRRRTRRTACCATGCCSARQADLVTDALRAAALESTATASR